MCDCDGEKQMECTHKTMTDAKYFAHPAISQSLLKVAMKSMRQFHWIQTHPESKKPTPEMIIGTAAHLACLFPGLFDEKYQIAPQCSSVTEKGTQCRNGAVGLSSASKWACGIHKGHAIAGVTLLSTEDAARANSCGLRMAELCGDRLFAAGSLREEAFFWTDAETGLELKAKIDLLVDNGPVSGIYDLKSTVSAAPDEFSRSCASFGYHIQAAFYSDAVKAVLKPRDVTFDFVAVEKEPPFDGAVYRLANGDIELGRYTYREILKSIKLCQDNDIWPGYPGGEISLPKWFFSTRPRNKGLSCQTKQ